MSKKCYYTVLEVERSSSIDSIKKSYRRLASLHHPDKNPNDPKSEERFKELGEAYEILKDPEKRASYDRFGHEGTSNGRGFGANPFNPFSSFSEAFNGESPFSHFFRQNPHNGHSRGETINIKTRITLEESFNGVIKEIHYQTLESCNTCKGVGVDSNYTGNKTCNACGGQGRVAMRSGPFQIIQPCPECRGSGVNSDSNCSPCSGEGRVQSNRKMHINIPKGIMSGNSLVVSGGGFAPARNSGESGNLIITVEIEQHNKFERKDNDLYCNVTVPFQICMLGGSIDIERFGEKIPITINPGTQTDTVIKISNTGMPIANQPNKFGNILATVKISIPLELNESQKILLTDLFSDVH